MRAMYTKQRADISSRIINIINLLIHACVACTLKNTNMNCICIYNYLSCKIYAGKICFLYRLFSLVLICRVSVNINTIYTLKHVCHLITSISTAA